MKQSKYDLYEYWINKYEDDENLWSGLFENEPIRQESLIVSPTILNSYSNQAEKSYVVYPNAKSLLGFLTYIYLPTAFDGVFNQEEAKYLITNEFDSFYKDFKINYPDKIETIRHMEQLHKKLNSLWTEDENILTEKLIDWTKEFNRDWLNEKGIGFSLHIFTSPKELASYIIKIYESDLDIAMLEDDLQMSKAEFISLASDELYTNEFMRRKFTDILTNRLNIAM